jgi:hypothetical protein
LNSKRRKRKKKAPEPSLDRSLTAHGAITPDASQAAAKSPQENEPTPLQLLRRQIRKHPAWAILARFVAVALAVVGILAFVDQETGLHPWPSPPDIEAPDSANSSSSVLPFKIKNTSLFPLQNVVLNCSLDLAYVMDANRKTIVVRDMEFSEGATAIDPETNYYCNSKILSVNESGFFVIGFPSGQGMATKPGAFTAPLTLVKLCVTITGTYRTFWFQREFQSAMFQWPSDPANRQWVKGPIAFDEDQSRWIPDNSTLGAAYGLSRVLTKKNPDGTVSLLPDALKCDASVVSQKFVP